jgi:hypothetical protein
VCVCVFVCLCVSEGAVSSISILIESQQKEYLKTKIKWPYNASKHAISLSLSRCFLC